MADPSKQKQYFAAIPARAIRDPKLTALHFKVLGAIAIHDRLNKNQQGCWAGNKRLAEIVGCDYSRLSAALSHLAELGYIERRENPQKRRQRVFVVIYTVEDRDAIKPGDSLRDGKQFTPDDADDSLPEGKADPETVCRASEKGQRKQRLEGVEYIPENRGRDFAEATEVNSTEVASPNGAAFAEKGREPDHRREVATYLRKIEAALKSVNGRRLTKGEQDYFRHALGRCSEIEELLADLDADPADANLGYQAQRLADEISSRLEGAAA